MRSLWAGLTREYTCTFLASASSRSGIERGEFGRVQDLQRHVPAEVELARDRVGGRALVPGDHDRLDAGAVEDPISSLTPFRMGSAMPARPSQTSGAVSSISWFSPKRLKAKPSTRRPRPAMRSLSMWIRSPALLRQGDDRAVDHLAVAEIEHLVRAALGEDVAAVPGRAGVQAAHVELAFRPQAQAHETEILLEPDDVDAGLERQPASTPSRWRSRTSRPCRPPHGR